MGAAGPGRGKPTACTRTTGQPFSLMYVATLPGAELDPRTVEEIRKQSKSFERLAALGYAMTAEVNAEGVLEVKFSGQGGQVYTTYTFYNIIVVTSK